MSDLEAQRVRELLVGRLGGVVPGKTRSGGVGRQRGHHQHVAATVEHRRQRRAHGVEHAEDVDFHQRPERLGIDREHRTVGGDARVGHDHVNPTEPVDRAGGGGFHRREIADVGHDRMHAIAAEGVAEFGERRLIEVGENQPGSLGVQAAGDFFTDPAGTAGDEETLSDHRSR